MRGILLFGAPLALCVSAACGNVNQAPDAMVVPDVLIPDASPDAPVATAHRWVIDGQRIPTTNPEAQMFGLDLNGDMVVDNQLGSVFAALNSQGFEIQGATDTAISRGTILMLGEAQVGGPGGPTAATFTLYTGANPQPPACMSASDPVCRRHLQGNASFDLAAGSPVDPPLAGTLANGTLLAGPGHLHVSIMFGLATSTPITVELLGARVRLQTVSATSLGQSVIAGGISMTERDTKLIPAIHQTAVAAVAADCTSTVPPDCGCAAGSTGRTYLSLFDTTPKDCVISLQEISGNSLIQSLLAPDVTLEGQQALSLGFGVTAVKATFTP